MFTIHRLRASVGLAFMAVAGLAILMTLLPDNPAAAGQKKHARHAHVTKVTMFQKGGTMGFVGPRTVKAGTWLRIVNNTDPRKVGPHTFTLLTRRNMPHNAAQMKQCEKMEGVCGRIAVAHKVNPMTFAVGKRNVDTGRRGWDAAFGRTGDSWYTDRKGEMTSRRVTARPGTVLRFFCVVHPWMQGKIRVVR